MQPLTIGQVAHQAGVGVETIRFYERQRLLEEPPRRTSGYRQYGLEAVERLRFIRQAKELGFTLKEIGELLDLRLAPSTTAADVKRRAQTKLADIDKKISALRRMRKALLRVTKACSGRGTVEQCSILQAIQK